jgi:cellulose synthase/poly-beta-1,6-N-acetylglucosamine synthase-like glycosyltransferase
MPSVFFTWVTELLVEVFILVQQVCSPAEPSPQPFLAFLWLYGFGFVLFFVFFFFHFPCLLETGCSGVHCVDYAGLELMELLLQSSNLSI